MVFWQFKARKKLTLLELVPGEAKAFPRGIRFSLVVYPVSSCSSLLAACSGVS